MKIKTKLTLGVGLLFVMIILLAVVSSVYINSLKNKTENILAANYNTLEYSRNMILALDELHTQPERAYKQFEQNLEKQRKNVTETGEKKATDRLIRHFNDIKSISNDSVQKLIRRDISDIMTLNMKAIQHKTNAAEETASSSTVWISVLGTLCFIIAFILLINLPNSIASPIMELTQSIRQIAARNYHQRVHFEGSGEFRELAESFNTMAQKLEEYNDSNLAQLMMEKRRIETLINNMHDPVIGVNQDQKILFINEEALKIIGVPEENLIGKKIQDISITNDLMRTLFEKGKKENQVPIKIFADKKESYFEKEIIPIKIIPTGEVKPKHIGEVLMLRNITPFKELDSAKTNFISTVSHELKTPIASIKMSLDLLQNDKVGEVNAEQLHLIQSIKDDSDRLLKITSELLNITQVETGNVQLSVTASDAGKLMDYAIETNQTQADNKHITFETSYQENLPEVWADKEKTVWVLNNLISNAIRYSYNDSVIELSIVYNPELSKICFMVKDRGQGIAPEYKDRIFDRYFRVPGIQKEGSGLGLAISKEFIEAQGGQIEVKTELGSGSTFKVLLESVQVK